MQLPEFELERYFARYEFEVPYLLGAADIEAYRLDQVLALAAYEGGRAAAGALASGPVAGDRRPGSYPEQPSHKEPGSRQHRQAPALGRDEPGRAPCRDGHLPLARLAGQDGSLAPLKRSSEDSGAGR